MSAWFETALGKHLLATERLLLEPMLNRRFGYHLLQLGCSEKLLHDLSPMGHKFSFCAHPGIPTVHTAIAQSEEIPLPNESVDMVLMHHTLDYCSNQHQSLREISRVLIAGGHVVIVGFNPYSGWGLRHRLHWNSQQPSPWNAALLSTHRISDWLKLLDFQIDQIRYGAYTLPINSEKIIRYSSWMDPLAGRLNWPTGGIYVIKAHKQVIALTPVQRHWRRLPVPAMGLPVADKVGQSLITDEGVDRNPPVIR